MGMEDLTAEIFPRKLARLESQRVSSTKVLETRRLLTKVNEEIGGMARVELIQEHKVFGAVRNTFLGQRAKPGF